MWALLKESGWGLKTELGMVSEKVFYLVLDLEYKLELVMESRLVYNLEWDSE